jgi:hypothetical protein
VEAYAKEERACGVNLDGRLAGGVDLDSERVVEAHAEEERARGMNLDSGHTSGNDLDDGHTVEAHAEEERGAGVEAVNAASRRTCKRSGRQWVYGREMTLLGFRELVTHKKKNSSDGHDDIINVRRYI